MKKLHIFLIGFHYSSQDSNNFCPLPGNYPSYHTKLITIHIVYNIYKTCYTMKSIELTY